MTMSLPCGYADCSFKTGELSEAAAVSVLNSHAAQHVAPRTHSSTTPQERVEKVARPMLSIGCSDETWKYFVYRWGSFKLVSHIKAENTVTQLMECCDEELRMNVYRTHGRIENLTETAVLEALKIQAVRTENVIIARVNHIQMRQDRDEPIRSYMARLKGHANSCEYTVSHTCQCGIVAEVSYSDAMVRDVLASGMEDSEIQAKLLRESN